MRCYPNPHKKWLGNVDVYLPKTQSVPELPIYNVVVCGGGHVGCPTARASWRSRRSVLLLEQSGQLGEVATSGGVNFFLGYRTNTTQWVCGIFEEIIQDL